MGVLNIDLRDKESLTVLINAIHYYYPKILYTIKIVLLIAKHFKSF
jgi:hypothetical protein